MSSVLTMLMAASVGTVLSRLGPGFLLALLLSTGVAILVVAYRRKKAKEASLVRLLARHPGWMRTNQPCGLSAKALAGRTGATPRGDRRIGVRYGIEGPLVLPIAGVETRCDASFFQWFSEERRTNRTSNGSNTVSYQEKRETVGIVRLPVTTSAAIRIDDESVLGRLGLTRGGEQVESSEFNRRFRVEGRDRTLTVQFLDANLQQVLLEAYRGRSLDLTSDLFVLGGEPEHRDDSLTGVVGELPAVRQDLERLVAQIPAQFWRAIGADRTAAVPQAPDTTGTTGRPYGTAGGGI